MFQQAAECLKVTGDFSKAAKMFEECGLYLKSFECFEYQEDWEGLLMCLSRNKDKFLPHERDTLINRYVPIALNSIYQVMTENGGVEEENKGKLMEEKYKKKNIDIIKEDSDESDSDQEGEGDQTLKENEAKEETKVVEANEEEKKLEINSSDEEEIIDTKTKEPTLESKKSEGDKLNDSNTSSFTLISKDQFAQVQDFEHLSNFDPDDDFLKSERSYSVIGSVLAKDDDALSSYSDFSLVSNSRISQIKGGNIIESDRDVYVEDLVMQKIIYFISLFSEDVKEYMSRLRSKDGLLQSNAQDITLDYFEMELDNIDDQLVTIILDVLEHFDMFRLCLIICNRYNLKQHVSRYLTSICYKYSNLKLLDITKVLKMNDANFRSNQKQVNVLANEAIHSMLQLIDPKMMQQQCTETLEKDTKLMGADCWRYLFYLGFWKKLVYLIDTHSSLKLCFTVGAFEDFKTVYLVNYRSALSDQEIKDYIAGTHREWISSENSAIVEYLCHKVAIEQSVTDLDNNDLNDMCICNKSLNKALKSHKNEDLPTAYSELFNAFKIADERFTKFSNRSSHTKQDYFHADRSDETFYNNRAMFCETMLPLFDIFYLYGRTFENKEIRMLIKEAMGAKVNVQHKMIRICSFLINLVDAPSEQMKVFSPSEITMIMQGIFSPQKVRIPEPSDLLLNSIPIGYVNRNSPFFKLLDGLISDFRTDRYNREFNTVATDYFRYIESQQAYGYNPIPRQMRSFEHTLAGKDHTYDRLFIADLEAEYVSCPLNCLLHWYKKIFYSFTAQTIQKDTVKEIPTYSEEEIYGNEHYNQLLLPNYIRQDYLTSLQLYSTNLRMMNKVNLGRIRVSDDSHGGQLRWYLDMYAEFQENYEKVEDISKRHLEHFRYMAKKDHLTGKAFSKKINKKLESRSNDVLMVATENLKNLEPVQKIIVTENSGDKLDSIEHDFLMQRAYELLKVFENTELIEESDFETMKQTRFNILISCVYILTKAGRLDVIHKFTSVSKLKSKFAEDKEATTILEEISVLIQAIEAYQCGKWNLAVKLYTSFLDQSWKSINANNWIRILETVWYLAICANWATKYPVYLPVNALNFVFEDCNIKEHEDENEAYHYIETYERNIDIQDSQNGLESSKLKIQEQVSVFIHLLSHFKKVHGEKLTFAPQYLPKTLVAMFNMIGTLMVNCEQVNKNLTDSLEFYISQTDVLQNDNIEKFIQYFGDFNSCQQFKNDFYEIDDYSKNDTLYFDVSDNAHNQYFVCMKITPVSENPSLAAEKTWETYFYQKTARMVAFRTLTKKLRLKVKDYLLHLKTEAVSTPLRDLSMYEHNWISLSDHGDIKYLIKHVSKNPEILNLVNDLYSLQKKLFNILNNHYSIRNSLDTHFVVGKLDEVNKFLEDSRTELSQKLEEIKNPNKLEESFNPFIEIDEEQKEVGFVDVEDKQNAITEAINSICDNLRDEVERIEEALKEWLNSMPEPDQLNIGVKQANLNRKLRWEKIITSKQKVKQLQGIFKMLRFKKGKK